MCMCVCLNICMLIIIFHYLHIFFFSAIPACKKCLSKGPRYRCIKCLKDILDNQKNVKTPSPLDFLNTQSMNKNITINISKSRKNLKDKCRKITKKHNNSKVTKKEENVSVKKEQENHGNLPEIIIEPTDFLNKIANEIDINTKAADSSCILDSDYFYSPNDCYELNSTYM